MSSSSTSSGTSSSTSSGRRASTQTKDRPKKVDVQVSPRGTLELLSQLEVESLTSTASERKLLNLFRRCALAVLRSLREGARAGSSAAVALKATYGKTNET